MSPRAPHALVLVPLLAACGGGTGPANYAPPIDPAAFSTSITNPLYPLVPGTVFRFEGRTADGAEIDSVIVTRETRVVMGVTTRVVRDVAWLNGALEEETLDWYAQDAAGAVWYFGEASRQYEHGVLAGTEGSWEAGVHGAQPGIVMEAHPAVGDRYREEYQYRVAEDEASVLAVDETVTVPAGTFAHCLRTADFSRIEPTVREWKWFCPGVGAVRDSTVAGGTDHSALVAVVRPAR